MQGSVLAGEDSPRSQGAAQFPRATTAMMAGAALVCAAHHPLPWKFQMSLGWSVHTSACASLEKTVASNHVHRSLALLLVGFTPREPRLRTPAAVPSHEAVSLPQLAKARPDKSTAICSFTVLQKWFTKIVTHECSLPCLCSQWTLSICCKTVRGELVLGWCFAPCKGWGKGTWCFFCGSSIVLIAMRTQKGNYGLYNTTAVIVYSI